MSGVAPTLSDDEIDRRLDVVLRAAGTGLRFYVLPCARAELRRAMRDVLGQPSEVPDAQGMRTGWFCA